MMKKWMVVAFAVILLLACTEPKSESGGDEALAGVNQPMRLSDTHQALVGCYTFAYNQQSYPDYAMLKLSMVGDVLAMQMKNADANKPWDDAEDLQALPIGDGFEFFKVNALDVAMTDIMAVAARPDAVMAIARISPQAQNIKGLDSDVIIHIAGAVNTIYQVACDDVPMDLTQ